MHPDQSVGLDVTIETYTEALGVWRSVLGERGVITDTTRYNVDTTSRVGQIPVVLRPDSVQQVQQVVRIAQRFLIPIYPLSTGNNWGYGTSVPIQSPGVIVDLGLMNRILELDEELGVVTLEPGVTQDQLSQYLKLRGLPFMVPVTGAGPSCSVIANALERGFGVTPFTDHCGALISLKAILPNGDCFESYTRGFNAVGLARAYRWGTGPFLDGLFSQSNLGIVVDASIALQPSAEQSGVLFFVLDSGKGVEDLTTGIRRVLTEAGQNVGGINLMSRSRIECLISGAHKIMEHSGGSIEHDLSSLPNGTWYGFGSIYGNRDYYRSTCRLIKRCLGTCARRISIHSSSDLQRLRGLSALATAIGWPHLKGLVDRIASAMDVVQGIPSTVALPLAYVGSGRSHDRHQLNPARDGCGLLWYSPIVPLRRGVVGQLIEFVEYICGRHGFAAPITLTTLSPRCYAGTIPILFDRARPESERCACSCLEELYEKGLHLGFVPYRVGAHLMPELTRDKTPFWSVVDAIKSTLDPNRLLAPGRYSHDGSKENL